MTAAMFQGEAQPQQVVRRALKPIAALRQGSVGDTMSDLQMMQQNERKQHEDTYIYEHGRASNDNIPLGKPSF